jgi:hypothetical protein
MVKNILLILLLCLIFCSSERYSIYYENPKTDYKAYYDASFTSGESPITLDILNDLGRYTYNGEVSCDGPNPIYVYLSSNGVSFNDAVLVKEEEILDITTHKIDSIIITNNGLTSGYRVRVW